LGFSAWQPALGYRLVLVIIYMTIPEGCLNNNCLSTLEHPAHISFCPSITSMHNYKYLHL
jgi:hypothetical protein